MVEQKRYARVTPKTIIKPTVSTPFKKEDPLEQVQENIRFLEEQKRKAQTLRETKIPERRFGRISTQKEAIAKRQAGTKVLTKVEEQIQEQQEAKQKIEQQRAEIAAQRKEASEWEAARSLVQRKGGWALYLAKGSDIYSKVKQLVDAGDLAGTTSTQTSVSDVQARAKEAELIKSYGGISGTDFTYLQEVQAKKSYVDLTKEIQKVQAGELTTEKFMQERTPTQLQALTKYGIIAEQKQPATYLTSKLKEDIDKNLQSVKQADKGEIINLLFQDTYKPKGKQKEALDKFNQYLFGDFSLVDFYLTPKKTKISMKESGVVGTQLEKYKSYFYMPVDATRDILQKAFNDYRNLKFSPTTEKVLGENLITISPTGMAQINLFSETGREITGVVGGGVTELIGRTPLETTLDVAGFDLFTKIGKGTRALISTGFTGLGITTALNEDLTPEQRTAGGIIAVLGAYGAYQEISPYVRGFMFGKKARTTLTGAKIYDAEVDQGFKYIDDAIKTTTLTPIEYAKKLQSEGKLEIKYKDLPMNTAAQIRTGTKPALLEISEHLRKTEGEKFFQEVIAHEIVHYKTPEILFKIEEILNIPYKLSPTEFIAYKLEKRLGKKGFSYIDDAIKSSAQTEIPIYKTFEKVGGDISLIPAGGQAKFAGERFEPKLKGDIPDIIKFVEGDIKLKKEFKLPEFEGKRAEIVNILKGQEDEILSGSLAQKIQTEGGRDLGGKTFKRDLDIISKNRQATIEKLQQIEGVKFKKKFKSIEVIDKSTGEVYADIVKYEIGEGGFVKEYPILKIEGLQVVDIRARLGGKLSALSQSAVTRKGSSARKAIPDIKDITSGKLDIGAEVSGGFAKTYLEQVEFGGEKARLGMSAIDFFKALVGDTKVKKEIFATPSAIDEPFLIRETRLQLRRLFEKPAEGARITFKQTGTESQAILLEEYISTGEYSPEFIRNLAKKADAGDVIAEQKLLSISKELKDVKGEFTISAQPRGELEVRINPKDVTLEKIQQLKSITVKGQEVKVIEAKVKRPEIDLKTEINQKTDIDLNKIEKINKQQEELQKLITESREKGFQELPEIKQQKLIKQLEKETGFNVRSYLEETTFVSPAGLGGAFAGTRLVRMQQQKPIILPDIRREKQERKEPIVTRRTDLDATRRTLLDIERIDRLEARPDIRPPVRPNIPPPERPIPRPFVRFPEFPKQDVRERPIPKMKLLSEEQMGRGQGYNVYTKEIKQKTFKKTNKQALTKNDAEDLLTYGLDNSVARSGYLKPTQQRPRPLGLNIPAGYAEGTRDKFRPFKIRRGKKIEIDGIIEKTGYAIDTRGEKSQLSAFKSIAQTQAKSSKNKENKMIMEVMNL